MKRFSTPEQCECMRLGDVIPQGWMKQQMLDDLHHGFAGCLDLLSPRASSRAFTDNHVTSAETTEAGMVEDTPRSWWDGETQAVWWDGFVRMAYLSGDQEAQGKADRIMAELLQSQDLGGYIGIYTQAHRYKHSDENGEFWTQSRAFIAMLAYYELTGREEYLAAVESAVQLTMQHYGPQRSYFDVKRPAGGTCHGLMFVDALEWLYRITGKQEYRDFGVWCYEDYNHTEHVRDTDNQLSHLLKLEEGFHWHTPHTTEHLRVPLWVASVTGTPQYCQGAENAFRKIKRYLVPSGACIGEESIKDLVPTPDKTYEYCAITELLTSLQSAFQKTGQTEWADMAEWIAFNAAQGARLSDGKGVTYMTQDNRFAATEEGNNGRRKFSPTHEDIAVCCNPNAVKLLPYYTSRMWCRLAGDEGLCAFCYGPSELRTEVCGKAVTIVEETEYPFSEEILFLIYPEEPLAFQLRLRVPGWATAYELKADGARVTKGDDGFCSIRKTWRSGDQVRLRLQCSVEPLVARNGEVAVKRGPLLYSLPIASRRTILRKYETVGFADFTFVPKEDVKPFKITEEGLDFEPGQNPDADRLHPWHRSPISLTGSLFDEAGAATPTTLIPIGCTILRQTTFPQHSSRIGHAIWSAKPSTPSSTETRLED